MKKTIYLFFVLAVSTASAQQASKETSSQYPPVVNFSAEQDHQHMMDQLGIKELRPGPGGDEKAPNPANYDEALANPYPDLPEVLTLGNGKKVTSPDMWWEKRRPEIVEDFEREVYGRVPEDVPEVYWETLIAEKEMVGWIPVMARQLVGRVDNSKYPLLEVNIAMTVVTPANAKGPVPVLMMFGPSALPAPAQPPKEDLEKINAALKELLVKTDPSLKEVFEQYPAYNPLVSHAPKWGPPPAGEDPPTTHQLLAAGWGYVLIEPGSIQADHGAGLTKGIIGLVNKGQPRDPEDWGALRAWAWGASRGLDYLETDPAVDAEWVGIEGVSRFGKAALVAMAFDQRFAMALIGSSGQGGAKLHRRNFGEAVENLTSSYEYHWMAGNYLKYGASEATFGSKNADDLPVDSHQLIALCAPRPVFISYGIPEKGDAKWVDQQGSYMATVAADPVYELLGEKGLGVSENYRTAKMPGVNVGLLDGKLAWRQHDGGHTDAPNIKYFIQWAKKFVEGNVAGSR